MFFGDFPAVGPFPVVQGGEGVVLCDFEAMHDVWNVLAELAGQVPTTGGPEHT